MATEIATPEAKALTATERTELQRHEDTIDRGRKAFVEVGAALLAIRDGQLHRETHETFERYVKERFDLGRAHAYRLIDAKLTIDALSPIGDIPLPATESQCRPLLQFEPEQRAGVWQDVVGQFTRRPITEKGIKLEVDYLIRHSKRAPYKALRKKWKDAARQLPPAPPEKAVEPPDFGTYLRRKTGTIEGILGVLDNVPDDVWTLLRQEQPELIERMAAVGSSLVHFLHGKEGGAPGQQ